MLCAARTRGVLTPSSPTIAAATGTAPSVRALLHAVAGRARGRVVTGAVLSRGVHAAGCDRRHRLSEQGGDLRPAVQSLGRDHPHDRGRSQASRRSHRHHLGAAHLGFRPDPSPACAHDRAGGRHVARWQRWVSCRPRFFLPVPVLSRLFRRLFLASCARRTRPASCSSSAIMPGSMTASIQGLSSATAQDRVGGLRKEPFGGPEAVFAICRATPTASPSPIAG